MLRDASLPAKMPTSMMPAIPLRELAAARWAQVRVERPDVDAALSLHQGLITTQIRLLDDPGVLAAAGSDAPEIPQSLERLAAGRRVLDTPPDAPEAALAAMHDLARLLGEHGAGEAALKIGGALTGHSEPHRVRRVVSARRGDDASARA